MDASDPTISFDPEGVCNHCLAYDRIHRELPTGEVAAERLRTIVAGIKRDGVGKPYDCIIGVSGGVDSTYVAYRVKELGLRPLAVHLDNGWNSEIAVSNISKALTTLGIDLQTHVIDWEEFKDIQRAFLLASTPDAEIPSDHAIFTLLYRQATRLGLRHIVTGLNVRTETHLPAAWSQGHWDFGYIRAVHRQFGSGRIKTFPHFNFYDYVTGKRHTHTAVNVLDYMDYAKKEALVVLQRQLGWKDYGGKHFENVYTRWFQGCYLPRKFGFDKRRSHLSSRLCSGEITRAEALSELAHPPYPVAQQQADCEYVAKKLSFSAEAFSAVMAAPLRQFHDYPSYHRVAQSAGFKRFMRAYQFFKYDLLRRSRR